jgi:protein phosphatase
LEVPEPALVLLVGASGSGKSTFALEHFLPTEVVSSDACRALVADDENDMSATAPAFELVRFIASKRLEAGRLTVIDATNVKPEFRAPLVALADRYDVPAVAIVFDVPERLCHERNRSRPGRRELTPFIVRNQTRALRRSLHELADEGFRHVHVLRFPEDVAGAVVERTRH